MLPRQSWVFLKRAGWFWDGFLLVFGVIFVTFCFFSGAFVFPLRVRPNVLPLTRPCRVHELSRPTVVLPAAFRRGQVLKEVVVLDKYNVFFVVFLASFAHFLQKGLGYFWNVCLRFCRAGTW